MTQADLRDKLYKVTGKKYRQATISSWEMGNSAPPIAILTVVAEILQVTINDLYEKDILQKEDVIYLQDLKRFEETLLKARALLEDNPREAFHLLEERYNELIGKIRLLSDSNARLKLKFNDLNLLLNS